jgi:CheY-like chemotaxis protein
MGCSASTKNKYQDAFTAEFEDAPEYKMYFGCTIDGSIIFASDGLCQFTHTTHQRICEMTVGDWVPDQLKEMHHKLMNGEFKKKIFVTRHHRAVMIILPNGDCVSMRVGFQLSRDHKYARVHMVLPDVTKVYTPKKLFQHDIRSPLHSLTATVGFVFDNQGNIDSKMLECAAASLSQMKSIIDTVNYQRISNDLSHPVIFTRLRQQVSCMAPTLSNHVVINLTYSSLNCQYTVEPKAPMLFERMMRNIISNAIKYTLIGQICVHFQCFEFGGFRVTVHDSGSGVSPEILTMNGIKHEPLVECSCITNPEHLHSFQVRFDGSQYSKTRLVRSTGHGMKSLCEDAEKSGANLVLYSTEGVGTCVKLDIGASVHPFSPRPSRNQTFTFMVVDDQKIHLKIMTKILKTNWPECVVILSECAEDAQKILQRSSPPDVNVVITDENMERDMSGTELICWIKANTAVSVTALLSGSPQSTRIADVTWIKPVSSSVMIAFLEDALAK